MRNRCFKILEFHPPPLKSPSQLTFLFKANATMSYLDNLNFVPSN